MYRVIHYFTDLHDKNHPYNVGDFFPREGITVSEERLAELAGEDNKQGKPLIEQVAGGGVTSDEGNPGNDDTESEKPEDEKADAEPEKPKRTTRKSTKASGK